MQQETPANPRRTPTQEVRRPAGQAPAPRQPAGPAPRQQAGPAPRQTGPAPRQQAGPAPRQAPQTRPAAAPGAVGSLPPGYMLAAVPLPSIGGDGGAVAGGTGGLTVADVIERIRRRWPMIAVPVAVGLALAVLATVVVPAVYTARASVLVQPVIAEQFGSVNLDNVLNMATEAELASSLAVATTAAESLGLEPAEVRRSLSVSAPQGTQVLDISYRSGTAQAAAEGAQTVATAYLAYREANAAADADRSLVSVQEQIKTVDEALAAGGDAASYRDSLRSLLAEQRQLTSIKATSGGRVITTAEPPSARTSPRLPVNLAVGGMAALLVGLVLAVFGPSRREKVRTATV